MATIKKHDIWDAIHDGTLTHIDNGVMSWDMDGVAVEFYVEEFTFEGVTRILMFPKAVIDACSEPLFTRSKLAEVMIEGLTGLGSGRMTGEEKAALVEETYQPTTDVGKSLKETMKRMFGAMS